MQAINYNKRTENVQQQMEEQGIELLLCIPSVNFRYLFKGSMVMHERLICGILSQESEPSLIAPSFEKERMEKTTTIKDVVAWKENEDPFRKIKEQWGNIKGKIALEPSTPFWVFLKLQKMFPKNEFVNAGAIVEKMRAVKTEEEIERIEQAMRWTIESLREMVEELKEGQTEKELTKKIMEKMTSKSREPSWALTQIQENSAIPHGSASEKKLTKENVILFDVGTSCEGYFSDITITTYYGGKPANKFLEVYEIVEKANQAALEKAGEGIPAEEVDKAARDIIEKAGHGQYFTHRLGHGLGLEVHEIPYIVQGNREKLEKGNVHTNEPGIYLPGKFGVRIEDDLEIRKQARRIAEFNRYFWE